MKVRPENIVFWLGVVAATSWIVLVAIVGGRYY
jgi:hypothetical protein